MAEVEKWYEDTRLSGSLFLNLQAMFCELMREWDQRELGKLPLDEQEKLLQVNIGKQYGLRASITRNDEEWINESMQEFVGAYGGGRDVQKFFVTYTYTTRAKNVWRNNSEMRIFVNKWDQLIVHIDVPEKPIAQKLLAKIDDNARLPENRIVREVKNARIFIGHGNANDWRELESDLRDKHGLDVFAFESGARAGHAIRDIITEMHEQADFAILVLSAEDEQADNTFRARQNVVHETGLFQGKLGYNRAIMVVEQGTETFSNVAGIIYLPYEPGRIRALVGDIVATLRREGLYPPVTRGK